ncbi:MAG TPA: phage holin family protein [Polyangia bacterium]|nr:phage holin family protein [Polyangia bacterium]
MGRPENRDDGEGIVARLKETADGLGQLVGDHVRLARIELVAEARSYARGLVSIAVAVVLLLIGYVFGLTAGALALARLVGAPLAFVIVAVPHLIAGVIAIVSGTHRVQQTPLLPESGVEAARTVNALTHALPARNP